MLPVPNRRECGEVVEDAFYSALKCGRGGVPLHEFLIDPAIELAMDVPAIGVHPVPFVEQWGDRAKGEFLSVEPGVFGISVYDDEFLEVVESVLVDLGLPLDFDRELMAFLLPTSAEDMVRSHHELHYFNNAITYHLLDMVGIEHYPSVAHFYTEAAYLARTTGTAFHRRIPFNKNLFLRISVFSRHLLGHRRAHVENWADFIEPELPLSWACPTRNHTHLSGANDFVPHCLGLTWVSLGEDIGSVIYDSNFSEAEQRLINVQLACGGQFVGRRTKPNVEPDFRPGIFAAFPLSLRYYGEADSERMQESSILSSHGGLEVEVYNV